MKNFILALTFMIWAGNSGAQDCPTVGITPIIDSATCPSSANLIVQLSEISSYDEINVSLYSVELGAIVDSQGVVDPQADALAFTFFTSTPGLYEIIFIGISNGIACPEQLIFAEIPTCSSIDQDNDGYTADVDCDDNNVTINPGAEEICDGLDNNCNGNIDEDIQQNLFYIDADGDGFGSLSFITSCRTDLGYGYVKNNTDCDDTNSNIYPGAPEICGNGIDENCNGNSDDGCQSVDCTQPFAFSLSSSDLFCPDGYGIVVDIANLQNYQTLEITIIDNSNSSQVFYRQQDITGIPGSYNNIFGPFDGGEYEVVIAASGPLSQCEDSGLISIESCSCVDSDNDTICDADDQCPGFNDLADADDDSVPDGCDICFGDDATGDTDQDGICDNLDICVGDDTIDSDADSVPDACDECPNDVNKTTAGNCGCGVPDTDTDGDGVLDCDDLCPNDSNKIVPGDCGCNVLEVDTDNDGILDCNDQELNSPCPNDVDANGVSNDTDGDGIPNCQDTCDNTIDSDGDGTKDCDDLCPNDADKIAPGDCGCNVLEVDTDNDGILDCNDQELNSPCPSDVDANGVSNDTDGDGIPNCQDTCDNTIDSDGDGTVDCDDLCPNDANKIEPGDCGCGNPDTDTDNDGIADCIDDCPDVPFLQNEICGDGIDNNCNGQVDEGCETCPDSDGDGVCDQDDVCQGYDDNLDSDADGIADGCDICPNLYNPNQEPDGDCDGITTSEDCDDSDPLLGGNANDADCDGVPASEDCNDNDPTITTSRLVDSDNDGTPDCEDACPNDPNKIEPGDCGCNNRDDDRDGDGVADCYDQELRSPCQDVDEFGVSLDSDGDGVPNCEDVCEGFDDNLDMDKDKIPDGCDSNPLCRGDRTTICHENNGRYTTLCVDPKQLQRHLDHPNDIIGGCTGANSSILEEDFLRLKDNKLDIMIYPNPSDGEVNFKILNSVDNVQFSIYNLKGIKVYSESGMKVKARDHFKLKLRPGIYILRLISSSETISKRFIISD